MSKKNKKIVFSFGTISALAIIPFAVVACSSTEVKVSTKDSSNLTEKGFLLNANPLALTIKDMPLDGLPNQNGKSTLGELNKYISITNSLTGVSLADSTIVSNISFTNGDSSNPAKINFSLGVLGDFNLTAKQNGVIDKDTKFDWSFKTPNFNTGKDLAKYLDGIENTGLESANMIIDPANSATSFNPNGIQEYIWFSKLYNSDKIEYLGALVGTWSNQNSTWEWVYNFNLSKKISPNSNLNDLGIDSDINNLDQLSKSIDFLPTLNQYSMSKDATVSVSSVNNNTQNIVIDWANNSVAITGKFSDDSWVYTYTYINKIILNEQMKDYMDKINQTKLTTSSSATSILPSQVNVENINQYINNLPKPPTGSTLSYKLVADDATGKLSIVVTILAKDQSTLFSDPQEVSGFLTSQELVQNYIDTINKIKLTVSSIASQNLPSQVNDQNITTFIDNLPTIPLGVTLSYVLNAEDTTGILEVTISASVKDAKTISANKQSLSGFLTAEKKELNNFITKINETTFSANEKGKELFANDSKITNETLKDYINGLPEVPVGITISFTIIKRINGSIIFTISATLNGLTITSESKTASGFFTNQQKTIEDYITLFNSANVSASAQGAKLLTSNSQITNGTLKNYINGIPNSPEGMTTSFTIGTRADGSLTFTVSATINAISKTSEPKTATGFLTKNQKEVNDYINQVNTTTISASVEGTKLLTTDSQITNANLETYIKDFPKSIDGITIAFEITGRENGYLTFKVSAFLGSATATSQSKIAIGFSKSKTISEKEIEDYIAQVNATNFTISNEGTKLLDTNTTSVTNENLDSLIIGLPQKTQDIILSFNIDSRADGSLIFTITATVDQISKTSEPKTLSGFLTNQQAIDNYINQFNQATISTNAEGAKLLATNTKDVTNRNLGSLIAGLPQNSQNLSLSFNIASRADGSLSFNLTASINGLSKTSDPKTATEFLKVLDKFKNLNLRANSNFAAPQNLSSYTNFGNLQTIFANFDMSIGQVTEIFSIENLYIQVSNSSLANGSVTLKLFLKFGNDYQSVGDINYTGFYKGNSAGVKTSVENYFKNNNNVAKWLNIYLNINSSWLVNIFTKNSQASKGAFFIGYNIAWKSLDKIAFSNISVTNSSNNVITIIANMPNPITYETFNHSTNKFVEAGTTEANEKVIIKLPFIFQTTGNPKTQVIAAINTSATGKTTIQWSPDIKGINSGKINYFLRIGNVQMEFKLGPSGEEPNYTPAAINPITF